MHLVTVPSQKSFPGSSTYTNIYRGFLLNHCRSRRFVWQSLVQNFYSKTNVNVNPVVRFKAEKVFQERYRYCQGKDTLHLLPWKRSRVYEKSGLGTN